MSTNTFLIESGGVQFEVRANFSCGRGGSDPVMELANVTLPDSEQELAHVLHPGVLTTIEEKLAEYAQQEYAERRADAREDDR